MELFVEDINKSNIQALVEKKDTVVWKMETFNNALFTLLDKHAPMKSMKATHLALCIFVTK